MYQKFKVTSLPEQNSTSNRWEVKFILCGRNCKKVFDMYTEALDFYMKCLYFTLIITNKKCR